MKLAVLGSTLLPNSGHFNMKEISLEQAIELLNENDYVSFVGHSSTAQYLSRLTGKKIIARRKRCVLDVGQKALCFKLVRRLSNNEFVTFRALQEKEYQLFLMERLT
ncbi:TPA: DUF1874 domain-containing protein [Listeria monocytogenes]|nr:DUF1874 domain-containing protein [Listeria monocytogenes serotype 1/2b]HCU0633150.1 DUF1874 domain-containing protein [Listeria monocytogenes]HCU0634922.1 DUF1874 domain-containing protein [Listeria monocytogenes]